MEEAGWNQFDHIVPYFLILQIKRRHCNWGGRVPLFNLFHDVTNHSSHLIVFVTVVIDPNSTIMPLESVISISLLIVLRSTTAATQVITLTTPIIVINTAITIATKISPLLILKTPHNILAQFCTECHHEPIASINYSSHVYKGLWSHRSHNGAK